MKTEAAEDILAAAYEHAPGEAPPHQKPDGLPPGFRLAPDGIHRRVDGKDGDSEWKWLCSPIRVLALPRDRSGKDRVPWRGVADGGPRARRRVKLVSRRARQGG